VVGLDIRVEKMEVSHGLIHWTTVRRDLQTL
jgi:hypothetical protein